MARATGDTMKLLRHLTGYLPVNIANGLAAFGGVYVFTRLLPADEYGRYALMVSAMALIHTLCLTWAEASVYRFTARAEEAGALPAHHRRALRLIGASLLAAWGATALVWVFVRDLHGYTAILPWIAVLLPLNTVVQTALESHRASQRVRRYALVETFRVLGGFLLGAVIAWQSGLGAAAPFAGMAAAALVAALSEGLWLRGAAAGESAPTDPPKAWLAYGLPIAAALVLDLVLSASDRFLIALFINEAAVGAYAAGYGVADKTVLMICAWAAMAGSPLVMAAYEHGGPDAAAQEARGLLTTFLLVAAPAAAGLALVAEPLSEAMIGEDLRAQAARIIPWIAFAGLLNGFMIHYFSEAFQLARKTALRAVLVSVPAGLNVVLNIILLPQLGVMGAVYATVASYAVGCGLLAAVGRRFVRFPLAPVEVLKTGLACLSMWPVIHLLPDLGGWLELIVKAVAGAATYGGAALLLNAGGARRFVADRLQSSKQDAAA
ncbi:MAG: lipopolysaccharide biosynthesis protein [Pseudomonadota bacterium]